MSDESSSERLVRLADVPKAFENWLPLRRRGKRLHVSTLFRWSSEGIRGVRLATVRCGGTRCVTRSSLIRFFEELHAAEGSSSPTASKSSRAAFQQAEKELDRAGIR